MGMSANLSINVIIVAALLLFVLIILIAMFSVRIKIFNQGLDLTDKQTHSHICMQNRQVCGWVEDGIPKCSRGYTRLPAYEYVDCQGDICCKPGS